MGVTLVAKGSWGEGYGVVSRGGGGDGVDLLSTGPGGDGVSGGVKGTGVTMGAGRYWVALVGWGIGLTIVA